MSNELITQELTPVSFLNKKEDTTSKGQKILLTLLKTKINKNETISIADIASAYYDAVNRNGRLEYYYWGNGERYPIVKKEEFIERAVSVGYGARAKCLQWFKTNLGSCIMKGKLLVIPVIDIEETSPKQLNPPI